MITLINFNKENFALEDSFNMVRYFLQLKTNHEIKMTSYKIIKKFKLFNKKIFSQQQTTVTEFIFLKLKRSYKAILESQICNYTYNYTAMTVTIYYYYLTNWYNSI
jgi:hypothetical protein